MQPPVDRRREVPLRARLALGEQPDARDPAVQLDHAPGSPPPACRSGRPTPRPGDGAGPLMRKRIDVQTQRSASASSKSRPQDDLARGEVELPLLVFCHEFPPCGGAYSTMCQMAIRACPARRFLTARAAGAHRG